ncbi:MAG TPA: hypothetical protein VNY53_08135, partial [Bradyrhizobium sp.]|nr:hypothetical protein [Bradyrhizobium sp.]
MQEIQDIVHFHREILVSDRIAASLELDSNCFSGFSQPRRQRHCRDAPQRWIKAVKPSIGRNGLAPNCGDVKDEIARAFGSKMASIDSVSIGILLGAVL